MVFIYIRTALVPCVFDHTTKKANIVHASLNMHTVRISDEHFSRKIFATKWEFLVRICHCWPISHFNV